MAESNPAELAAAQPADPDATAVAHAVGVGPGNPACLTARARDLLANADLIVGFETVLDVVRDATDATLLTCAYDDQASTLETFGERVAAGETGVAVLMGDPNVSGYQFLGRVDRAVDGPVRVVPGISSIQVAASRARTPLEHSTVVSLHRRGSLEPALSRLRTAAREEHVLCLPRPYDWMPGDVAFHLREAGIDGDRIALVFEHLTMAAESCTRTTLAELADSAGGDSPEGSPFSDLAVLVVRGPDPIPVWDRATEGLA